MPVITGLLETALYVADVAHSAEFYRNLLGFETLVQDERFAALSIPGRHVLLLFRKGATKDSLAIDGGVIPGHEGGGALHLAFSIPDGDQEGWRAMLAAAQVSVESEVRWPRGGMSLYFRDPDGHLVELVTPGCWAVY